MDDFTFEYAGKTFECYIESRGLLWGHATLEPPGEPEKSPRWHYRVNGGEEHPGPVALPDYSPGEVKEIIKLFYDESLAPGAVTPSNRKPLEKSDRISLWDPLYPPRLRTSCSDLLTVSFKTFATETKRFRLAASW